MGGGDNQRKQMERKRGEGIGKTINITNTNNSLRNGEEGTIKGNKWKGEKEWEKLSTLQTIELRNGEEGTIKGN